jgi:hypothetical protein
VAEVPVFLLQLGFDVHTSGQIELHQRINSFVCWVDDVHQTLVRSNWSRLVLLTCGERKMSKRFMQVGKGL